MESWYGMPWSHKNRHAGLLRVTERERLANMLRAHQQFTTYPPDSRAGRVSKPSGLTSAPSSSLRTAEQA